MCVCVYACVDTYPFRGLSRREKSTSPHLPQASGPAAQEPLLEEEEEPLLAEAFASASAMARLGDTVTPSDTRIMTKLSQTCQRHERGTEVIGRYWRPLCPAGKSTVAIASRGAIIVEMLGKPA